jgi:hypothetical protein
MTEKIKITKEQIEAGKLELPDGYELKKVKTKMEIRLEVQTLLDVLLLNQGTEPSDEEIRDAAKAGICHPYYEDELHITELKETLKRL